MSAASAVHGQTGRWWIVALVRAVIAMIVGAVITFVPEHSAHNGLLDFGFFALATGIALGIGAFTLADRVTRWLFFGMGVVSVVAGGIALAVHPGSLAALLYIVSVWGILTGFAELYCALRGRRSEFGAARDFLLVGALTAILALLFLFIPADPLLTVGLFGAYAVVIGVYLAIGAFTLKWANADALSEATENSA